MDIPKLFSHLWWVFFCGFLLLAGSASADPVEASRPVFLQAEQAIKQGRLAEAESLLPALQNYPLLPHLVYLKLTGDLGNSVAVRDFLARYPDTRQAVLLRQRWLEQLAAQADWAEFALQYRETTSQKLKCHQLVALMNLGRMAEALDGAEKLWLTGNALPDSCDPLFKRWQASPAFTTEHIWKRLALSLQKGNLALAGYLQNLLPVELRPQGMLWRQIHDNPRLLLGCAVLPPQSPAAGLIFSHGIDRLATDDPELAQTLWALRSHDYPLDPEELARLDRRTGLALAAKQSPQAAAYLLEMPTGSVDAQIRGWRVRAVLGQQNWQQVLTTISWLADDEKNQAQWRYWQARALAALGDSAGAFAAYQLAAKERDFYGFNAADHIGAVYPLPPPPLASSDQALQSLAATAAFAAIHELAALGRDNEVRLEWLHVIKTLSIQDLPIAAQLARQWGLDNLALLTAAKAGIRDDLSLLFPLGFSVQTLAAAQAQQLDAALVYGVVRRESAFDPNAGSPVGARGLMQLMPATAETTARRLGEPPGSLAELLEPGRNLRFGTAYLRMMLDKFAGQFALAVAAYNAGPHRVERWLPNDLAMPADLWVETIPFSETRQYVAAVLANAVIYQSRLNQSLRRLSGFLPEVLPVANTAPPSDRVVSAPICE